MELCHEVAVEMIPLERDSEPACRSRLQTTLSCCGRKAMVVRVKEKSRPRLWQVRISLRQRLRLDRSAFARGFGEFPSPEKNERCPAPERGELH
ncbi:MAG: hypothetical protein GTO24_03550 [candidate division Zixibacteria bacterium]|nr:hypothetical protein [candidate division Zixibacteria bacterium]